MPGGAYEIGQIPPRRVYSANHIGNTAAGQYMALELVLGTSTGVYILGWASTTILPSLTLGSLYIQTTAITTPVAFTTVQRFGEQPTPKASVNTGHVTTAPTGGQAIAFFGSGADTYIPSMPDLGFPLWVPPAANRRVIVQAGIDGATNSEVCIWWAEP